MTRRVEPQKEPVRVALIGCGAVARIYYAPALEFLEERGRIRVVRVFDPDSAAMNQLARRFSTAKPLLRIQDLTDVRLAIVASPPRFHSSQAIQALQSGAAVLCEKPLAHSIPDAEAMVATARETGGVLAVGFVRRWLPAVQTIRMVLKAGLLGSLSCVSCFEGASFQWPARSRFFFQPSEGGGVLADTGPHVFDLFLWWFGWPTTVEYEDDALGGVEANCRFRLSYGSEFQVTGRLSRDWEVTNAYYLEGSKGWLRWKVAEPEQVEMGVHGSVEKIVLRREDSDCTLRPTFESGFIRQITNVIECSEGRANVVASADDGLAAMRLAARCCDVRKPMRMGWLTDEERRAMSTPAWVRS